MRAGRDGRDGLADRPAVFQHRVARRVRQQGELVAAGDGLPHDDDETVDVQRLAGGQVAQGNRHRVAGMESENFGRTRVGHAA